MDAKKLLIAFDDSDSAARAVRYVAHIISGRDDFSVVLLYIERLPERDTFDSEDAWKTRCASLKERMREKLAEARAVLAESGMAPGAVGEAYMESCKSPLATEAELCSMGDNIALDILDVQRREGAGTIVVGRRGITKSEEALFGSVSNRLMRNATDCAVWVVE